MGAGRGAPSHQEVHRGIFKCRPSLPVTPGAPPGSKVYNASPRSGFDGRFIVVADEDRAIASLVIQTLLDDGHAVFQAYDGLSAFELALNLKVCDLLISNIRVGGVAGLDLIQELREHL